MENVTLEQVNKNIILLRQEIQKVAEIVEESYLDIEDDLDYEIEESRKNDRKKLISHEEMKKEFGNDND
ncbi:MAG: hypothetical protein KKE05_04755 [Nanoarchaeota archaeon]|nr:hypothetical protein [Nanoarchaeota archaeon]